jgi:pyruvate formate-lyase activating enzyme-like uncharacterized protein
MLRDSDDLSWYARKAARLWPAAQESGRQEARLTGLLERLREAGVKGDPASMTFYTKRIPPGCRGCLQGRGTNVYVTGLCTRDCFFCFNQKPRKDELVVHGIPVRQPEEAVEIVKRYGLRSVGLSGGEPLLRPIRVLRLITALRKIPGLRIDLYTNGDRACDPTLALLRKAGLDSVRFDLAARGYDTEPVERALRFFPEVAVEMPVIPEELPEARRMVRRLDKLGVPFMNLHELFISAENETRMDRASVGSYERLLWRPAEGALHAALDLLLFAAGCHTLSAYLCSCGTQEQISKRGYRRRRKLAGMLQG